MLSGNGSSHIKAISRIHLKKLFLGKKIHFSSSMTGKKSDVWFVQTLINVLSLFDAKKLSYYHF